MVYADESSSLYSSITAQARNLISDDEEYGQWIAITLPIKLFVGGINVLPCLVLE